MSPVAAASFWKVREAEGLGVTLKEEDKNTTGTERETEIEGMRNYVSQRS